MRVLESSRQEPKRNEKVSIKTVTSNIEFLVSSLTSARLDFIITGIREPQIHMCDKHVAMSPH